MPLANIDYVNPPADPGYGQPGNPPLGTWGPNSPVLTPPIFMPPEWAPPGTVWPPLWPSDPGYGQGRPMPPTVGGGPAERPPHVGGGPATPPAHPGGGPAVPPAHPGGGPVAPERPVDPGWGQGRPVNGLWMMCWIPGFGTRWVRIDPGAQIDNSLPPAPQPKAK